MIKLEELLIDEREEEIFDLKTTLSTLAKDEQVQSVKVKHTGRGGTSSSTPSCGSGYMLQF